MFVKSTKHCFDSIRQNDTMSVVSVVINFNPVRHWRTTNLFCLHLLAPCCNRVYLVYKHWEVPT